MPNIEETVDSDDLIKRMKDGEESAFEALMRSHWDRVFSRAYGLLKNREDAEEVAQDTFLRAKKGVETFRGECSASTWLHRIATNLARNKYWYWWRRKRAESLPLDAPYQDDPSSPTLADTIESGALSPSEDAIVSEFSEALPRAIDSLDEKYRQILLMRTERDLSYEEIAAELDITVGTVKSRLSRAREQLRDALYAYTNS
ncbi:MAG: sigma-70 family RNA polymerase sigma factor [Opitutales bacterium]|nr:sigma-70 family RNA polymerase sigma factor [Opitutales bacterium]